MHFENLLLIFFGIQKVKLFEKKFIVAINFEASPSFI